MGRPSMKRKRAKRNRQKVNQKYLYSLHLPTKTVNDQLECEHETEPIKNNSGAMGGADTDLLEMALYDDYRLLDGESSTPNYLSRCQQKLMTKVKESKTTINELEKEVDRVRLEKKEENERIRKYYEVIAYGKSRSGQMVRSAMGTAPAAAKIIKDLKELYSVSYNSDDDV